MKNSNASNLASQAYRNIMKKIINAEYQPGEKIAEKEIEEDIGIGRTPIREAMLQLRHEGLLNVIPQSGTYISKIDMKEVLDARFVRASVEQRIMRNATTIDMSPEQLIKFKSILSKQKIVMAEGNFPLFLTSDDEFHQYFYIITNYLKVWNWIKKINIQFDRFRFLRLNVNSLSLKSLVEDHEAILEAVKNKDIYEVERLTANHMHRMLTEKDRLINSFPNYFVNYQSTK